MADQQNQGALISPLARQREIEKKGVRAWLVNDRPPRYSGVTLFHSAWQICLNAIRISEIGGPARMLYHRWDLRSADLTRSLFANLLPKETLLEWDKPSLARVRNNPPHEIYVERINGEPFSHYMELISERGGRAKGLLVQFYGTRNMNPCNHCERRYLSSFVKGTIPGSTKVHVMWPFYECISVNGFNKGVCGNCMYHLQEGDCSYHAEGLGRNPNVRGMKASREVSAILDKSLLNSDDCPILREIDASKQMERIERDQNHKVDQCNREADEERQKEKAERAKKAALKKNKG